MDLTFNVIFVPGTVRYLQLGVLSLMRYSPFRYRLVPNGLGRAEAQVLMDLCRHSDRLEFFSYPSKQGLPHGTLLNLLQQRERGSYFCLVDSDVFAVGPFEGDLVSNIAQSDVFSSCYPAGLDPAKAPKGYAGLCLQTPGGLPLAATFCCVYRTEPLRQVIEETQVGFETYRPQQYFPESVQALSPELGLNHIRRFDTGKLLNVLSYPYGVRFRHREIANLIHIGGVSRKMLEVPWSDSLLKVFRRPYVLRDDNLEFEVTRYKKSLQLHEEVNPTMSDDDKEKYLQARVLKNRIATFSWHLLRSIMDGYPQPVLELNDSTLRQKLELVSSVLRDLHQEVTGQRRAA